MAPTRGSAPLRAHIRAGETLLVHAGAGGVGSAAIQLGLAAGARVIATAGGLEKVEVLRAYLKRWKAEVGVFFSRVSANAPDGEIRRIAPNHPVFRLTR